jgi:hypothetical protein
MSDDQQFDMLFTQVLQQGKGIEPLFQSLFSFLRRKTDFFKQAEDGFSLCEKAFKVQKLKFELDEEKEKAKKEKELLKQKQKEQSQKVPEEKSGVKEITKEEFERRKREEQTKLQVNQTEEVIKEQPLIESKSSVPKKEEEDDEDKKRKEKCAKMDESVRQELIKRTAHLDDKNGGRTKNYTWVQHQVEQFEMFVPIDSDVNSKNLKITFDSKHLRIVVKGEIIVDGELFAAINSDSFLWTIDEVKGKKVIVITFDKIYKMQWWDYVIKGDELLTLSKVNPDPSKLSDLDPSMRPEIEKMMLENSMKMQGKPFHKDPKTNDMLQKFMKEHPEMDFSKAQIN